MDKYIGKKLDGRYEITELIGVGGMANVYKAHDVMEDRLVAVKILREEYASNSEFLRRFKNESRAISVLNHPNIVKVYDVSFTERVQFIVMELIDGITLKEYIGQQGQVRWKEAVHFTVQTLRALQHAHDKGIVHRDIKPENLMLLRDGTLKVMDFGIARFSRSQTATITDKAIGSVHYISPEQARGEVTDGKTDLYAVGVILYEMLTGRLPFEADSAVSVAIKQIQSEARRPRQINPDIPEGLEVITLRAMQKDPARRYQSAAEMLRDIEEFKRNPSISFEYKYLSAPAEEKQEVGRAVARAHRPGETAPARPQRTAHPPAKRRRSEEAIPEENVEYVKKTPFLAILTGIAAAFALSAATFIFLMFYYNNPFVAVDEVNIPDFVGVRYDTAISSPRYANFNIIVEEPVYSEEYEKGVICEQKPKYPKVVKIGSDVRVKISNGAQMITMKDYSNMEATEAFAELKKQGLEYSESRISHPSVPSGYVVRTDPVKDSEVKAGTVVTVYTSIGPQTSMVPVPKVTELYVDDARSLLNTRALKIGTVETDPDSEEPYGTVISQSPEEGEMVAEGSFINLVVSQGESDETRLSIPVTLPSGINKPVTVQAFMDDVEIHNLQINPTETTLWKPTFMGEGIARIVITINEKTYQEYLVDFDEKTRYLDVDNSEGFRLD
ncbi:MAG: Stk1 family PASTA domain-containing Ser/Thr kinase [Oscillospiraceae bacterium]|nr:Stk1 family PASTA domain-containing Ser/Thr kinase [Oscillospiraceae bacterium]